jgi:EAL domain-containing protein (putative c-di-GMP-specific phosphodiesterase class I)/PleD family two-component response regulator
MQDHRSPDAPAAHDPAIPAAPAPLGALLGSKIMMVDDEVLMTDLIQTYLEDQGYTDFVVTNDPCQALALLRQEDPGVLLLDLMMPGMSGFEVLEAMRADPALRYTPVIVLTASSGADAKLRALQLGATDFLAKPVDESELVLRVRNTLAFRQYHLQQINFDRVTDLPLQRQFDRNAEILLQQRTLVGGWVALFSLQVPEYRQLRESVSEAAADEFARMLARRLNRFAHDQGALTLTGKPVSHPLRVGRLGADHFALLFEGQRDAGAVEALAKRLLAVLAEPVVLDGHEIVTMPWIGIAVSDDGGSTAETMRTSAELAATHARSQGVAQFEFASPELNAASYERLKLGSQLRGAVQRGELRLHYQPKVQLASGAILGAEALVRWQHPELGLLAPGQFIALAEELGLISRIGEWVITQACADAARWPTGPAGELTLSLNVARPQFESGDLCNVLRRAIAASGIAACRIVVELTESMLMDNVLGGIALMHEIKALGVTLSIDDFGTGYSSLSYLKRFPLDELKIDRSFVGDLPGQPADVAIVRTVIELGHSLGMRVTAEGVETEAQRDCLRQLDCDDYQGFLFSRPVPGDAFLRLLAAGDEPAGRG